MAINGVTASGTTSTTATPLTAVGKIAAWDVQTVPANSGVILPNYADGPQICIIRNSGANSLNVYPIPGGTINGTSAAYPLGTTTVVTLWAFSNSDWVVH